VILKISPPPGRPAFFSLSGFLSVLFRFDPSTFEDGTGGGFVWSLPPLGPVFCDPFFSLSSFFTPGLGIVFFFNWFLTFPLNEAVLLLWSRVCRRVLVPFYPPCWSPFLVRRRLLTFAETFSPAVRSLFFPVSLYPFTPSREEKYPLGRFLL